MPYTPHIFLDGWKEVDEDEKESAEESDQEALPLIALTTYDRLINYLEDVLNDHYSERWSRVDDLMRWQEDYWAEPSTTIATEPFLGAATIIIPLSAIAVEALHSDVMMTLFAFPQFVSVKSTGPGWEPVVRGYERFLNRELLTEAKIYGPLGDSVLELIKYGTGIAKVGYERVIKYGVRTINGVEQEFPVEVKRGLKWSSTPNGSFLMPFSSQDAQSSEWVAEEHTFTPYEVETMEYGGLYYPGTYDKLKKYFTATQTHSHQSEEGRFEDNQEVLENMEPIFPRELTVHEFQMAFNVDGSKKRREIVVHYHRQSRTVLSIRNNPYSDLHREWRHGIYFPIEHRWYGIGACKQNEQFQAEITTQHRQRLDNGTLANIKMFALSDRNGYGPDEPIFPGKIWLLDDVESIKPIDMGEVNQSSFANEQSTLLYSQQRLGVNELNLGMPQVGTPGTATSDLTRIQEGKKKRDFILKNIKTFTDELIIDSACILQQYGPRRIESLNFAESGELTKKVLELPEDYIRDSLVFELSAIGQQQNKIVDRQNWAQVAQFLEQYYTGLITTAQMAGDQKLMMEIIQTMMVAATEASRQMLESFDIRNIDRLIMKKFEIPLITSINGQQGQQQIGSGGETPTGTGVPNSTQNPANNFTSLFQRIAGVGQTQEGGGS